MEIGATIKKLRRGKDMTQEDLAEFLNISSQAVSRWETNLAMPDINMLPSLANLFGVTIDELMGMDEIRNQAYLDETYRLAHEYISNSQYTEAANILRKAIKTFPGNYGLLSELAISLSFGDVSTKEGINATNEAIALCERVLANSTSEKLRSTTRTDLCFLYKITGADQKAVELSHTLPHVWESREMILPEILEGQESTDHLKKAIHTILVLLSEKISTVESGEKNMKKMIAIGPGDTPITMMARTELISKITDFLDNESKIQGCT